MRALAQENVEAAVTRSEKGCVVLRPGAAPDVVPARHVDTVVDTTGAGDLFAAGYLVGLSRGESARRCGELGALGASEIIKHLGARPQVDLKAMAARSVSSQRVSSEHRADDNLSCVAFAPPVLTRSLHRVKLKITTWNINSVRLRMPIVARFLRDHAPDVLCLQETKCRDAEFPFNAFRELGYDAIVINGQKGYHGVAIVARVPLSEIVRHDFCDMGHARHLGVRVLDGDKSFALHNFYVPAGGDEPDRDINPKFAHKLDYIDALGAWSRDERIAEGRAVLVGDLNVAPLEQDVWNHKALLKVVSHTPIEVEKFTRAFATGPWVDALRHFIPEPETLHVVELSFARIGSLRIKGAGSTISGRAHRCVQALTTCRF